MTHAYETPEQDRRRLPREAPPPDPLARILPAAADAERALLGSMMFDATIIDDVRTTLRGAADFYTLSNQAVYEAIVALYEKDRRCDLVTLRDQMERSGTLDGVGGYEYLIEIQESVPTAASGIHYARIVRDKAKLRDIVDVAGRIMTDAFSASDDPEAQLTRAEGEIFKLLDDGRSNRASIITVGTMLQQHYDYITSGAVGNAVPTGFSKLDSLLGGGLHRGEYIILAARPSVGKAQPIDAQVLTPDGFRFMGEISVGDDVIGSDGKPTRVIGVYPQGERDVFRVTFTDGGATECCEEHLWLTQTRNERRFGNRWSIKSAAELRKTIRRADNGGPNHRVPMVQPVEFNGCGELPMDPYVLGVWLGDGCGNKGCATISNPELDICDRINQFLPDSDVAVMASDKITVRIKRKKRNNKQSETRLSLQRLGLAHCCSWEKFVPRQFMFAGIQDRLRLLCGLMDTDGWVHDSGAGVEYCTASPRLAEDVRWLVWSLGGMASCAIKHPSYEYLGEKRMGRPSYRMGIYLPHPVCPVSSNKHLKKWTGRQRGGHRKISSIEPVGRKPCRCIRVAAEDQLYVTDDFIVTHNTALAMDISELVAVHEKHVLFFSLEMSRSMLSDRLLAKHTEGVSSANIRSKTHLGPDDYAKIATTIGRLSDMRLHIDESPTLTVPDLRSRARRAAVHGKCDLVVIDYLQLIDMTGQPGRNRENDVSEASRGLKAMARELNVPVLVLSQLNRKPEDRAGGRPKKSDLRDSGSLEQDADVILLLHRDDVHKKSDPNYEPTGDAILDIAKQRNGPTLDLKLKFDPERTTFREAMYP